MSQTKLHDDVALAHVFAIGGIIIATQHAFEFRSQYFHEYVGAARRFDLKERVQTGAKTPRPPRLAALAMARLVRSCQFSEVGGPEELRLCSRDFFANWRSCASVYLIGFRHGSP